MKTDVLTPLPGGHVFAGTWEALATLDTATCEACGEYVKLDGALLWSREEGGPGADPEGLCAGWRTPTPDVLLALVRGMIRETPNEEPNGPTEAAIVSLHEAHLSALHVVLPGAGPDVQGALRREADAIATLTFSMADDARALDLAHQAHQRAHRPAPGALVTAEELAEFDRPRREDAGADLINWILENAPRLAAEVRRLTAVADDLSARLSATRDRVERHCREVFAAEKTLRDEREAHAAALAAVQAHAAELEAAYGTRASEAIAAQARAAEVEKKRDELQAEVARLRGEEPGR